MRGVIGRQGGWGLGRKRGGWSLEVWEIMGHAGVFLIWLGDAWYAYHKVSKPTIPQYTVG